MSTIRPQSPITASITATRSRRASRQAVDVVSDAGARDRILDAAIELFALHGLHGMSLQMLADAVGLHKSTLFHHFTGKDELGVACLERVMEAVQPVIAPLRDDDGSDLEVVVTTCEAMADHFTKHSTAALFLTRCLIGGQDRIQGDQRTEIAQVIPFFATLSQWLDRARRAGTIRPIRVRHGLVNLMGLVLFYPSIAGGFGKGLLGFDPTSTRAAKARREELGALVRAALAPRSR